MRGDFTQVIWDDRCREACRELARLAIREDLGREYDWTSLAVVPTETPGKATVVAREAGVVAGLAAAEVVLAEFDLQSRFEPLARDSERVSAGQPLARLSGSARSLLTAERTLLNFLGHLSGVATLTRAYVDAVAETKARIYDTRKTLPGWRLLDKYAVRMGGGFNHRLSLFDAVLIKDNHLALGADPTSGAKFSPPQAVAKAKKLLADLPTPSTETDLPNRIVEVEIDRLGQLEPVLAAVPDIVLLDNMSLDELREAVAVRDRLAPHVELEASGGVNLDTVADIARTGVERISIGALTHSARWLDVSLDWSTSEGLLPDFPTQSVGTSANPEP